MATLSSLLPKPRQTVKTSTPNEKINKQQTFNQLISKGSAQVIPPYGQRSSFRPRFPEDFGNGGAFPEISMVQYPLDMGRKKSTKTETSGGTLTLQVDADGNVAYDNIARQGHAKDRIVHTSLKDLVPIKERKDMDVEKLVMDRPGEEEVMSVAEKTKAALERIVQGKIKAAQPKNVVSTTGGTNKDPTYIRYTPSQAQGNDSMNSGAKQRIIRMVDAPVDPMAPPSFLHKKVPRGPPSPPAPVMHSPPRKLSAKEQAEWIIPPCISNWKNTKGYTIPLDKRLAADGRGLQELTINDNFAKFSEALYAADRHAREEVRQRNLMQQKLAQKEKDAEEEKLRELAQKAREERSGFKPSSTSTSSASSVPSNRPTAASLMPDYDSSDESSGSDRSESEVEEEKEHDRKSIRGDIGGRSRQELLEEDEKQARERDQIRRERQKQREREMRMSHMGTEAKAKHLAREHGRDISEKIALGLAKPSANKESMYDARLFNQSEGISSGFKNDDSYSLYDKPLFNQTSSSIYKFRGNQNESDILGSTDADELERAIHHDKFGMKRGFKGAEGSSAGEGSSGPVEFEKEMLTQQRSKDTTDKDVFGLDTFLNKAKKGKRTRDHSDDDDDDGRRKR
ncbi:SKIP/SNW domain-containing protein [Halteromyces radiatus]|uniref:SKIP/SNW domain-containing protein n=1 Tax=Halteromyces radiatus TaxID=101107 RepID=UPI00221FE090|nr:SKIP/SNW domain-containing protein [Halteromyces radiatus]KAI8079754.1 SKIP/SNW domain-containing protein [Halteromyces radiatus]